MGIRIEFGWLVLAAILLPTTALAQTTAEGALKPTVHSRTPIAAPTNQPAPSAEKPLLLNDNQPLLLLEDDAGTNAVSGLCADNSRCLVCHLNFAQETLAYTHARTNIGCATCHGPSDAHIADESWASGGNGTPPDIMFHWTKVGPGCLTCHKTEQVLAVEKHKPNIYAIWLEDKVCTDCHGQHHMANRKCKWK